MGAQENKQAAQDAYAAFSSGDAEGAMRNIDDSIEWTVRGDNALTGTYNGKQAVGELWGKFMSKDFRTEPHDFVADGDKVVVLTTVHLDGETIERRRRPHLQRRRQARRVRHARRRDGAPTGCSPSRRPLVQLASASRAEQEDVLRRVVQSPSGAVGGSTGAAERKRHQFGGASTAQKPCVKPVR